jgi:hypothetical protein
MVNWNPTEEELTRIYKAANGEEQGKGKPLSTKNIFNAMRLAIRLAEVQRVPLFT